MLRTEGYCVFMNQLGFHRGQDMSQSRNGGITHNTYVHIPIHFI